MEGSWRALAAWLAATLAGCALILGASGCGGDESSAVGPAAIRTADPERTFAPLLEVAADEPWRPMSARWMIERSVLRFAEDDSCPDRKIAVGRTLPELRTDEFDWIYPRGMGSGPNYYRNPYDASCELKFGVTVYADQLTRPHDPGQRIEGVRPDEGFYLDLVDESRPGPPISGNVAATTYADRIDEGDSGVRLRYWMLFGMHGDPGDPTAHEGDWVRVDVVARANGDSYEPLTVQLPAPGSEEELREVGWEATARVEDTHPVIRLTRATHEPSVATGDSSCADCTRWRTWQALSDARSQLWYGFGGAWGEPGTNDATTGPLGPHRYWQSTSEKEREKAEQAAAATDF